MHSICARANAIFALMLWVLTAVTLGCFFSTVFLDYTTSGKIEVGEIKVRKIADYASESGHADVAHLDFSLAVDVSKAFNWNVKQLFLYLVAEYETPAHKVNQVVIRDEIVHRAERVVIDERKTRPEYWYIFCEFLSKADHAQFEREKQMRALGRKQYEGVDIVISVFCLESACKNYDEYRKALKNMLNHLRPGGRFILGSVLDDDMYNAGNKTMFTLLRLSEAEILNALTECDIDVESSKRYTLEDEGVMFGMFKKN